MSIYGYGPIIDPLFDDVEGQENAVMEMIKADGVLHSPTVVNPTPLYNEKGVYRLRKLAVDEQFKRRLKREETARKKRKMAAAVADALSVVEKHNPPILRIAHGEAVDTGDLFQFCNRDGSWRDTVLECKGVGWATDEIRGSLLAAFVDYPIGGVRSGPLSTKEMWCPLDSCRKVFWEDATRKGIE